MIKTFIFIIFTSIVSILASDSETKHLKIESDTSKIFYYSFRQEKVIDIKSLDNKIINEKLEVCQGSKVLLEAPIFYANAFYFWEGPSGFRSYSPKVLIENVDETQSGIYTLSVKNSKGLVSGQIELKVHKKPLGNFSVSKQKDFLKYELTNIDENAQIVWKDAMSNTIGIEKILSVKPIDASGMQLFLNNGKCENIVKIN